MNFELLIEVISLVLGILSIFIIIPIIKRTHGEFCSGWKIILSAYFVFILAKIIKILDITYIQFGILKNLMSIVFIIVLTTGILIIADEIKLVSNHKKLKKH